MGRCGAHGSYSVVTMILPSPSSALGEVALAFWLGLGGRSYTTETGKRHKSELSHTRVF